MSDISLMDLMEVKKYLDKGSLKVVEIVEDDGGGATLSVEVTDEFVTWFKQKEGLKRWSNKRFQKFFDNNLQKFLRLGVQSKE
jgi:hypothetical protein